MKKRLLLLILAVSIPIFCVIVIKQWQNASVTKKIVDTTKPVIFGINNKEKPVDPEYNGQKLSDLEWSEYTNDELGIRFTYPYNLKFTYIMSSSDNSLLEFGPVGDSLKVISIKQNTGSVVYIDFKKDRKGTLDGWVDQANYLAGTRTSTFFKGKPAILYEITDVQTSPASIYIFRQKGYLVAMTVNRPDAQDLFNKTVITRILDSLQFRE